MKFIYSRCPAGKIKLHVRPSSQSVPKSGVSPSTTPRASTPMGSLRAPLSQTVTMAAAPASLHSGGTRLQLVQQGGTIKGEGCYLYNLISSTVTFQETWGKLSCLLRSSHTLILSGLCADVW